MTPESMIHWDVGKEALECNDAVEIADLRIMVKRDGGDWATQLLYSNEILIEGRQRDITQAASFILSFH
jgi:hypothetical protein